MMCQSYWAQMCWMLAKLGDVQIDEGGYCRMKKNIDERSSFQKLFVGPIYFFKSFTSNICCVKFTCFPLRFWSFLLSGRDPISEIPIERFDVDELYEEDRGAPGKVYAREGGFIPGVEAISGCKMLGKRSIGCLRCLRSRSRFV